MLFFVGILVSSQGKLVTHNFESLDEAFKKKFKVRNDVFEGHTVIWEKRSADQNIRIKPYLIIKDGEVFYRVGLMYDGYHDWLNFSSFKFLLGDQVFELPVGSSRKQVSYKITAVETSDLLLSESEIEIFRRIGNEKTPIKYRISGERRVDLKLYENQYIKYITDLYDFLTN